MLVFSVREPRGRYIGNLNVEHRPNKRMTYTLQKQINKKALKYKGNKRSHKIIHLSWKYKCWNHAINSWLITGKAPTSSPILTVKTTEPTWARRTVLNVQLSNYKFPCKNNLQYWSLFPTKWPKDYPCQTRVLNKRLLCYGFDWLVLIQKMLTCNWDLEINCPRYYKSSS